MLSANYQKEITQTKSERVLEYDIKIYYLDTQLRTVKIVKNY